MSNALCEIKCLNCGKWFISRYYYDDPDSFFNSTQIENRAQCNYCTQWTYCDKKNMRFGKREQDGKISYIESK